MSTEVGRMVGKYRILENIGSSGIATVYKAYDPSLNREVALKVLHAYFAKERELVQRFLDEMDAIVRLRHPNIVPVYEYGEEDGSVWIAMEYIPGGSLKDRLKGPLDFNISVKILAGVAAALDYAHDHGIFHRNIKLSNIFVPSEGRVLLSDFGMATLGEGMHPLMKTGLTTPMPEYMSPEQAEGHKLDRRSDVYTLGVLLYELLTHEVPYFGDSAETIWAKQTIYLPTMPSTLNPAIPEAADEVIAKALTVRPEGRYATAGEMAQRLDIVATAEEKRLSFEEALEEAGRVAPAWPETPPPGWTVCPECGRTNRPNRQFCSRCGAKLPVVIPGVGGLSWRQRLARWSPRRKALASLVSVLLLFLLVGGVAYAASRPIELPAPSSNISSYVAGEWAMWGRDPAHTSYAEVVDTQPQGKLKWRFVTGAPIRSSVAVVGGKVYLATGERRIVALDAQSGELLWEAKVTGPVDSSPAVANGLAYVGLYDGRLLALDAESGELRWEYQTGNPIYGSPTVADGVVYVGSGDQNIYALDAVTGSFRWKHKTNGWIASSPAVSEGLVCVGSRGWVVYVLDAETGQEMFKYRFLAPLDSSPAISGNIAYMGGDDRSMRAIDMRPPVSRTKRWIIEKSLWLWTQLYLQGIAPEPPVQVGFVWLVNSRGAITTAPAVAGDTVYFGSHDGRLYALEAATGKERWQFKAGGAIGSSPAVVGGAIYFGSDDGRLYVVDKESGTKLWDFATGGKIMASPAVAKGVIYIGSTDGVLYAIE